MNEQNYASLDTSKRLVEAGIVLETECIWFKGVDRDWHLTSKWLANRAPEKIPAPSMAEVWRELPSIHKSTVFDNQLIICKSDLHGTVAGYGPMLLAQIVNPNPTDALIDLLIWVRKEAK